MFVQKKHFYFIAMLLCFFILTACSSDKEVSGGNDGDPAVDQPQKQTEDGFEEFIAQAAEIKAEISVFENSSGWTQEQFMSLYGNQIQKKYPNFSFKLYSLNKDFGGVGLPELIAQGVSIDLIKVSGPSVYSLLIENDLQGDISELIKKFNYNWNSLYPVIRETMQSYGDKGEIYGIPNGVASVALFYNKDIFDKFGLDYPNHDLPMTWDETYDLAKNLTRKEGDIQYSGLQVGYGHVFPVNQFSQGYIDPQTNRSLFAHDNWRKLFENFTRVHEISGNDFNGNSHQAFWDDGTVAMNAAQSGGSWSMTATTPINWDVAELPRFKELPDTGPGMQLPFYAVAKTSKHLEQAFLAAAYIGSEEFQIEFAKEGYMPPLKIEKLFDVFGSNVPELAGKNLKAAVPLENAAPAYPLNAYHSAIIGYINQAYVTVVSGTKDINTALREAEEQANIKINEVIASQK